MHCITLELMVLRCIVASFIPGSIDLSVGVMFHECMQACITQNGTSPGKQQHKQRTMAKHWAESGFLKFATTALGYYDVVMI